MDVQHVKRAKDGNAHVRLMDGERIVREWIIRRGDYYGTTDNRADRWYVVWLDGDLIRGLDGPGFTAKGYAVAEALTRAKQEAEPDD